MQNQVEMRTLGKTGTQISPVGLGTMEFSGGGGLLGRVFPVIPQEEKNAIVAAAIEGGINWFDTAEIYGLGISEQSLAKALKACGRQDGDVVIATKWSPFFRTASSIPRTIEDRLRFLEGYSIDLYMVHNPWGFSTPEGEIDAMADLVEEGKIRSVGVSNFSPERMRRAHKRLQERGLPLAVNQVHYSLLNRKIETDGILETAKELGVTIIAYTPIESGLLSGKYHQDPDLLSRQPTWKRLRFQRRIESSRPLIEAMQEMAENHQATVAQVALNWVINAHGDAVVTIPGATMVSQARENAGAMKFRLSGDDMAHLNELSQAYR